jgi:DDE superfamily endonuclease
MHACVWHRCKDNNIHVLCFPAHTTHILQPLDISVFGPLKAAYSTQCASYKRQHPTHTFNKINVASTIGSIWSGIMTPNNIQSGFAAAGIYPLNTDKFNASSLSPASLFQLPSTSSPSSVNPIVNIIVEMTPPKKKPEQVKIDTTHATFLTSNHVIQQLQAQQQEKQQKETEVSQNHIHKYSFVR